MFLKKITFFFKTDKDSFNMFIIFPPINLIDKSSHASVFFIEF